MSDEHYMRRCVALAHEALAAGEVPVGAIVVDHDRIVSEAGESIKTRLDPSADAELIAIQAACRATRSLSLSGLTLYSTVEPCVLCAYVIRAADHGRHPRRRVRGAHAYVCRPSRRARVAPHMTGRRIAARAERARRRYRPPQVRVPMVAESPPASGRVFYHADSG